MHSIVTATEEEQCWFAVTYLFRSVNVGVFLLQLLPPRQEFLLRNKNANISFCRLVYFIMITRKHFAMQVAERRKLMIIIYKYLYTVYRWCQQATATQGRRRETMRAVALSIAMVINRGRRACLVLELCIVPVCGWW